MEFQKRYFVVHNSESLFGYDPSNEAWTKFATVEKIDNETWKVVKRDITWFANKEEVDSEWVTFVGGAIAEGYYNFDERFLCQVGVWQRELSYIGEFGFKARKELRTKAREWIKANYSGLDRKNHLTYFNQMC